MPNQSRMLFDHTPPSADRLPFQHFPLCDGPGDRQAAEEAYLSVGALFDHRASVYGDRPFVGEILHIEDEAQLATRTYSYAEVSVLVDKAMAWLHPKVPARRRGCPPTVVGYLGKNGIAYVVWSIALTKMGLVPLTMSTTLAPSAAGNLLRNVGATCVLYLPDAESLAMESAGLAEVQPLALLPAGEIMALPAPSALGKVQHRSELSQAEEWKEPYMVIHSSGSTGVPKHYTWRHSAFLNVTLFAPDDDVLALTPMSHGYVLTAFLWALALARTVWFHPPAAPLTPVNVLRGLKASNAQRLYAVPIVLNSLIPFADQLTHLNAIACAGSPLSQATGDALVAQGVKVFTLYGQSEHAFSLTSERDFAKDKEWNYPRLIHPAVNHYFRFEVVDGDKHELIVAADYPALAKFNRPNGECATGDIWEPHPTRNGLWRYVGRMDDLIVHSTGHKTDPLPMEGFLSSSPLIKDALVVGKDRPQAALLIIPTPGSDEDEMRELILQANASAPSHSRIVPELVAFLDPNDEFVRTAKQSIVRGTTVRQYESVIERLYDGEPKAPLAKEVGTVEDVKAELQGMLKELLPPALSHSTSEDLFALGMNSLIATQLRNAITRTYRTNEKIPQDVVFAHPSIDALASFLTSSQGREALQPEAMRAAAISQLKPRNSVANGHANSTLVVLLTGVTGTIGINILYQLSLISRKPIKVLCPVRAATVSDAEARISSSLTSRMLPALSELIRPDFAVEAYPHSESLPGAADTVIHCAWPVNFNYTLSSFQPTIDSTLSLLNTHPRAHHVFLSSISVGLGSRSPVPEAIIPTPPKGAMGYAASKWVTEGIFSAAASRGFHTSIIRVGQITGDSKYGIWNETEAPPLMMQASLRLGVAPDRGALGEEVRWLPVDQVGGAIVAVSLGTRGEGEVYHLVAQSSTTYQRVLEILAKRTGEELPTIPYAEWVQRLTTKSELPAAKLMTFWETHIAEPPETVFAMECIRKVLADAGEEHRLDGVDEAGLVKIIDHYRHIGFL